VSLNSTSYYGMAYVYDKLMQEAPYRNWIEFAKQIWARMDRYPSRIADLACGTGSVAILFAKEGLTVTGIDLSEEMLAVSFDKAKKNGIELSLFHQDMREFVLPYKVDAVTCFCDSINYLTEPADVQRTFRQVYNSLEQGGVFLFDVHSLHKIRDIFADHTFTFVEEDISYIWECFAETDDQVVHELTIFVQEGDLYRKIEETHFQRGYSTEELVFWLTEAGFTDISITGDFTENPPSATSERIFFAGKK
jgi:SAM-dependent methyltransferase